MVKQIQVAGVGTLEFPDETTDDVIQKAVNNLVAQNKPANIKPAVTTPPAKLVATQESLTAPESLPKQLLGKARGITEQFQKGSEIQTRELGELIGGVPQAEQMVGTREPIGAIETGARLAGEFLAPSPIVANVPGLAFTINNTASMVSKAAKASKLGGVLDDAAKAILEPIARTAKKSIGFVGEVLSSVPREFFEKAIDAEVAGNSIFKGPFKKEVFSELGERAQKAMNFIRKEAGKEVGETKAALRGKNIKVKVDDVVKSIDDEIAARTIDGVTTLDDKDIKFLTEIRGDLGKGNIDAAKLNLVKKKIANEVKFDVQTVKKTGTEAQGILKKIGADIDDRLVTNIPELGEVNAKFSQIADTQTRLQTMLKDANVARNLRNLANKDQKIFDLFVELDALAPNDFKFMDDLSRATVRSAFDSLFPGSGGGSGSASGFANILRVGGIGSTTPAALPLISPKVQGKAIQGTGKLLRGTGQVAQAIPRGIQKTGITPTVAGATTGKTLLRRRKETREKGGS